MSIKQINITIGTAGHIDHGKTALVKCLTGCDTDRLKAEKERGMSIDLGFAPCEIAGLEVGIVDVPGHENFIKTMVAGASGIDGVVLVVAADDGVMPQTREHLDVLTLLGVEHGMVVITKIDRVESDHLEIALADVQEFLQGTFLDGAPIVPVSNVTFEGFDQFRETLTSLVKTIQPHATDGVFRLPVDRAFSAKGHGTIVAGIPVSGSVRVGDELVLLPHDRKGQIRRIQVYGCDSDTVMAGQCAAVNVPQWEHRTIQRGQTAATAGYFSQNNWHACTLRLLTRNKLSLKSGARVKFHTGTSETNASVYLMEGNQLHEGARTIVQVRTEPPIVAAPGDHFIVRSLSPVQTIGGGVIIEALPRRLKRSRPQVHEDLQQRAEAIRDETEFVEYCVRAAHGVAAREKELSLRAKTPRDRLQRILADLTQAGKIRPLVSGLYIHRDADIDVRQRILDAVRKFHQTSPERLGVTLEELQRFSQVERSVLKIIVAELREANSLVEQKRRLALLEHRPTFRDEDRPRLEAIESMFRESPHHPPSVGAICRQIGASPGDVERIISILIEHERLITVAENLVFHREAVERAREKLVSFLRKEGKLESVQFKYILDTTRKYAIPLLDYFDRIGVLRRVKNTRYLNDPPSDHPQPPSECPSRRLND